MYSTALQLWIFANGLFSFTYATITYTKTSSAVEEEPFQIIWNSPTKHCEHSYGVPIDVKRYGIKENDQDDWMGSEITLFYEGTIGLYPKYLENGQALNGGLPQLGNLSTHLHKAERDIQQYIPESNFPGLGVIDWEAWRPLWDRDFDSKKIYRDQSVAIVEAEHPDWSEAMIYSTAKAEFEAAARAYMEGTIRLMETIRPEGKWGYYGFPRCDNKDGKSVCSSKETAWNDQILWLFNVSTAIYPAAYLDKAMPNDFAFVHGQVHEALRVRQTLKAMNKPIYLYGRYRLRDDDAFYPEAALNASLQLPANLGAAGVILWGATDGSNTRQKCQDLKQYIDSTLGPFVARLLNDTFNCGQQHCSSRGRCVAQQAMADLDKLSMDQDVDWSLWSCMENLWQNFLSIVGYVRKPVEYDWTEMMKHAIGESGRDYECYCFRGAKGRTCSE